MQPGTSRTAALVEAPGSLVNGTQSWAAARIRAGFTSTQTGMNSGGNFETFFSWQIDTNNRITCFWDETSKTFSTKRVLSGVFNQAASPAQTFSAGSYLTLVFAWTSTTLYVSVNGAPFTSVADTNIPAGSPPAFLDIGARASAAQYGNSDVVWFAAGTGTLTNADAATINGFGNSDPTVSLFPAAAQATFAWDGTSSTGSLK
jgi:hypothetical protein